MPKTRRLSDLYVTGREFVFNDDSDEEPITVYIRKLNPVENEKAVRKANAARARALAYHADKDSEGYQASFSQAHDLGDRDQLIQYLIAPDLGKKALIIEAELSFEPEWSDNDYLQGLRDAWADGLAEKFENESDDPEVKQVHDELIRFNEQVQKILEGEKEALTRSYEDVSDEDLVQRVVKHLIELEADVTWMNEFHKCEVWLSVRETDKKTLYFRDREELDELSEELYERLEDAYRSISVDITEGKDSAATDTSSQQPEPPSQPETEASSGLKVVSQ